MASNADKQKLESQIEQAVATIDDLTSQVKRLEASLRQAEAATVAEHTEVAALRATFGEPLCNSPGLDLGASIDLVWQTDEALRSLRELSHSFKSLVVHH